MLKHHFGHKKEFVLARGFESSYRLEQEEMEKDKLLTLFKELRVLYIHRMDSTEYLRQVDVLALCSSFLREKVLVK
jgi:hypothetical protein